MEEQNEQIEVEKHTAGAEEETQGENKTEISLGKFKNVSALLSAYNSLEAEFTKRCQRIKELEGQVNQPASAEVNGGVKPLLESEREEIVKEYLNKILTAKQTAVIVGEVGAGLKAPVDKPKSIREAGMLAKGLLKK